MKLFFSKTPVSIFIILFFFLMTCFGCENEDLLDQSATLDEEEDTGTFEPLEEPDFIVSGNIVRNDEMGVVQIHLSPIIDGDNKMHIDLSKANFQVQEDGKQKDFLLGSSKGNGKAWTFQNFKIIYDHSDSMNDENHNTVLGLQPFLDFQVCDLIQMLKVQLVFFKDKNAELTRVLEDWWEPNLYWSVSNQINNSDYYAGGNFAENPLNAIMNLWNDSTAWVDGYQRTFLLVTDAPMHQPNDGDSWDHDNTGNSLQAVCNALQSASAPAKGTVHVVSPQTRAGAYPNTLEYWDNRVNRWTSEYYTGHANPKDLATCTGGQWLQMGSGDFYKSGAKDEPEDEHTGPGENVVISFPSSDLDAVHSTVVRVTLDNGQQGEIRFQNIEYPDLGESKAPPTGCDPGSCQVILERGDSTGDGIYWIDPDGDGALARRQVYCDMDELTGGWTLVMLSNATPAYGVSPYWTQATTGVTLNGSLSSNINNFDMLLGVKYWNYLGDTIRHETGSSSSNIQFRALYDFSLDDTQNYKLILTNSNLLAFDYSIGWNYPGMWSTHRNMMFSTRDRDNDQNSGHCATYYGNTPWWYASCWNGNIWGGGKPGSSHADQPYWQGAGTSLYKFAHGAIYIGDVKKSPVATYLPSCRAIRDADLSTGDGLYTVDVDGNGGLAPFQVYCNMSQYGGGWTLVALNNKAVPGHPFPSPTWNNVINNNYTSGSFGNNVNNFDMHVALKYWNYFGTTAMVQAGTSSTAITDRAYMSRFKLEAHNNYKLILGGYSNKIGSLTAGFYGYSRNRQFTTMDADHDVHSGNCGTFYTNAPWWYGACWSGSIWGGGSMASGYGDWPYWYSSSASYRRNHMAIYIR